MNHRLKKKVLRTAQDSGFCLWTGESWGPKLLEVDWSSNYNKELEQFYKSIVEECAELVSCNGHVSGFELSNLILEHFGVNNVHPNAGKRVLVKPKADRAG